MKIEDKLTGVRNQRRERVVRAGSSRQDGTAAKD